MEHIAIAGCGWLGFELAKTLRTDGADVRGTSRSETGLQALQVAGITPYAFEFGSPFPTEMLRNVTHLILAFPLPKTATPNAFETFVDELHKHLPANSSLIFTSSTSVYAEQPGNIDETNQQLVTENVNYFLEQALLRRFSGRVTILRLGGLIGEDRHPVNYLAGKETLPNGQHPVNLVDRRDVIRFIRLLIRKPAPDSVYNLVYPEHPTRAEYYIKSAKERGLPTPTFTTGTSSGKQIDSTLSKKRMGFTYRHTI